MPQTILDGDFTLAQQLGPERQSFPFSINGDETSVIYEADFLQLLANFAALSSNSPHPSYSSAYLIEETPRLPWTTGSGIVKWTRRYATIPITRSEPTSISFRFPGIVVYQQVNGLYAEYTIRVPRNRTVNCRQQLDYFLIGANGSYSNLQLIPSVQHTGFYTVLLNGSINLNPGQGNDVETLYPAADPLNRTTPTTDTWLAWVAGGVEVVAEDSTLQRWQGNIIQRTTKYVVAQ